MSASLRSNIYEKLDFVKIIPPDLKLFDNISVPSDDESEYSGPFSEYEYIDGYSENRKSNQLNQTDFYSYFSFSDEFKSAVEFVKSETKNLPETEETETAADDEDQAELEEKAREILQRMRTFMEAKKRESIDSDDGKSNSEAAKAGKKAKSKDEKKNYESADEDYFDTMSGYWRMLAAYDDFRISPPDYNAYENEKPHWLQTKPIPIHVMENSRKKCLDWLKENFEVC